MWDEGGKLAWAGRGYPLVEDLVQAEILRHVRRADGAMPCSGRFVGRVLATLVSVLNPSLIVIGGGVAHIGPSLLAEIRGAVYGGRSRSRPATFPSSRASWTRWRASPGPAS